MLKNKTLHEKIEQAYNRSKRKAFRSLSPEEDMKIYLELYGKLKGPVRNELLCLRGIPQSAMGWRRLRRNGNQRTVAEIND